jgi:hypothetical protein
MGGRAVRYPHTKYAASPRSKAETCMCLRIIAASPVSQASLSTNPFVNFMRNTVPLRNQPLACLSHVSSCKIRSYIMGLAAPPDLSSHHSAFVFFRLQLESFFSGPVPFSLSISFLHFRTSFYLLSLFLSLPLSLSL